MDDQVNNGTKEPKPGENPPPAQDPQAVEPVDFIEEPELYSEKPETQPEVPENHPVEPENPNADPLQALRKSLLTEEPEPEVKQNLFSRVTGTLSLKKAGLPEPTFGVKTAGNPGAGGSEEMQDDFFQQRLGTPQTDQQPPQSSPADTGLPAQPEPAGNSIVPVSDDSNKLTVKSKVSPPDTIGSGWDDDDLPQQRLAGLEQLSDNEDMNLGEDPKQQAASNYRNPQRFIAYNPKQNLWGRIRGLNRIDKILVLILAVAVIALIIFMATLFSQSPHQQPAPVVVSPTLQATVTLAYPVPIGLHLPGGWSFDLKVGSLVDGKWNPQTSEWLEGTEIRRVIAIPWNKQLEAVFQTFTTSDIISLDISNGDKVDYKVKSVTQVPVTDSSVLYDTSPSLAIVLIDPTADTRWVIVAVP